MCDASCEEAKVWNFATGVLLLGILGGGIPPGSSNPDATSEQKMLFFASVFIHGLKNPCSFSDLEVVTKRNIHVYIDRNYVTIDVIRTPTKTVFLKSHFEFAYYTIFS